MLEPFEPNGVIRVLQWWDVFFGPLLLLLAGAMVVGVRRSLGCDD